MTKKNRPMGILYDLDLAGHYHQTIMRGALQAAEGRALAMFSSRSRSIRANFAGVRRHFDGFIGGVYDRELAARFVRLGFPAINVSMSEPLASLPRVVSDDVAVGVMAADYLLSKGFRQLVIAAMAGRGFSVLRRQGFVQRLAERGLAAIEAPAELIDFPLGFRARPGAETYRRYRKLGRWLAGLPSPLGLFAVSDNYARRAVLACREAMLSVPEQVAVLGVDNEQMQNDMWGIPLSSIELDGFRVGHTAMSMLLARLEEGTAFRPLTMVPPLRVVERQTTDFFAGADARLTAGMQALRTTPMPAWSPGLVCDRACAARQTLDRLFSQHLGRTVREEIERLRVAEAMRLLADTPLQVKQVAAQCGFRDPRRLALAFRRQQGQTPGEYRARFTHRADRPQRGGS